MGRDLVTPPCLDQTLPLADVEYSLLELLPLGLHMGPEVDGIPDLDRAAVAARDDGLATRSELQGFEAGAIAALELGDFLETFCVQDDERLSDLFEV